MDPIEEKLYNRYLNRFYPVVKVKVNKHFKRGIEITKRLDGIRHTSNVLLNTVNGRKTICEYIIKDLIKVFGVTRINVLKVVEDYVFFR
jgi:hypothetical protein